MKTNYTLGWTEGDGSGHEGYNLYDYFIDGDYLGPDRHGIEPTIGGVALSSAPDLVKAVRQLIIDVECYCCDTVKGLIDKANGNLSSKEWRNAYDEAVRVLTKSGVQ